MGHKSAFYAYVFPLTFTFYIHLWLSSLEMVILAGVCSLRVHLCKSSFNFHFLHPLSKFYFHLFFQFGNGHSGTSLLSTLTSSPSSSSPSTTSPSPAPSIPLWESPMKGRNLDKHSKNSFVHFQYCMLQQNRIEKRIFSTTCSLFQRLITLGSQELIPKVGQTPFLRGFFWLYFIWFKNVYPNFVCIFVQKSCCTFAKLCWIRVTNLVVSLQECFVALFSENLLDILVSKCHCILE